MNRARQPCALHGLLLALALLPLATSAVAGIKVDVSDIDLSGKPYRQFRQWVDAAVAGNPGYAFSATDAAWMFRLSGKADYCTLAVALSEKQVSDAEQQIQAGQRPEVAGDSYLYAGPMISSVAYTWDWCRAQITPAQRQRWADYSERTLHNIWNHRQARWGDNAAEWTGWATDNPGNNYYYSFLEATMTWALASDNPQWLRMLREDKLPAVVAYFAQLGDGGSREGTGYGVAQSRMFALFSLWQTNTGSNLADANDQVANSIVYWAHATMPTLDQYAPIGDQSRVSQPLLHDYHRGLVLHARAATTHADARSLASWWLNHIAPRSMQNGFSLRTGLLPSGKDGHPPAATSYHARGVGHWFARSGWDHDAMWLGVVAGPYEESHAHQDQGAFTLFARGWLAVSENIWTHSGIQQGTDMHNMLRFERAGSLIPQRTHTRSSLAVEPAAADGTLRARADLTAAYLGDPGIQRWQREFTFAQRRVLVHDRFKLGKDVRAVFQITVPDKPRIEGNQIIAGRLRARVVAPLDARIVAVDFSQRDAAEFRSGWRVDISGSGDEFQVELAER